MRSLTPKPRTSPPEGRVLMFTCGHAEVGGCAQRATHLAQGLAAAGWDVRLIGRAGSARRVVRTRGPGYELVDLPGFGSKAGGVTYVVGALLYGAVHGRRARLLTMQLGASLLAGGLNSRLRGVPLTVLTGSCGARGEVAQLAASLRRGPHRWILRRAALAVAQTPAGAAELETLVRPGHIRVLPTPLARVEDAPLDGRPRVLFAGRLMAGKGLEDLLEAWGDVVHVRPAARLTIAGVGAGDRSVEPALRARVAADSVLTGSVRFTGWVADVAPLLRDHDVHVQPSHAEGMSNALVEALGFGRVAVVSDIPGNVEVVGANHPLLFAAGDARDLARALRLALDDPDIRMAAVRVAHERRARLELGAVADELGRLLVEAADAPRRRRIPLAWP